MSKLLNCLLNKDKSYVPLWFMRQAGRYLPEFREIRKKNQDFLKLCFDSELASEITLQPLKRYELDAAIIFSDILVVPHALGQKVVFEKDKTPHIDNFNINQLLDTKEKEFISKLSPIYKTIKLTRKLLHSNKSLIGFVGAPWTLIIYLLNLKDKEKIKSDTVLKEKKNINLILNKINDFLKIHILHQKEAGADIIQIFDTWAGLINPSNLNEYCFQPNLDLVNFCKKNKIASICFPKGIKNRYYDFVNVVKPDGISIDSQIDPLWASEKLKNVSIQGGMNPELLLMKDSIVLDEVEKYLDSFKDNAYIFNLGHGILPKTNPEIIKKIVNKVQKKR